MMSRCQRLSLILVVALTAMALSAAVGGADGSTSGRGSVGDAAFAVRGAPVDGTLARLSGDERRGNMNSERTLKQRLVVFAVLTLLPCAAHLARRRLVTDGAASRPRATWWSPHPGRSPPSFSTSIA
jgi:hypothetical protein